MNFAGSSDSHVKASMIVSPDASDICAKLGATVQQQILASPAMSPSHHPHAFGYFAGRFLGVS